MPLSPNPEVPAQDAVVLVPIRSFDNAKSRLASMLSDAERTDLARTMAEAVVRAAHGLPVFVISDDPSVIAWAPTVGATPFSPGVDGLNESITAGYAAVGSPRTSPSRRVIIAHADLPLARDLRLVDGPGLAIAPDRRRDGSNVMSLPASAPFRFAYGPGSFQLHQREAARCGLQVTVIDDPCLSLDIDHPEDLTELTARQSVPD